MSLNEGSWDRLVRFVVGVAFLMFLVAPWPYKLGALLAVPAIGTAFIGYCPLYRWMHVSTMPNGSK